MTGPSVSVVVVSRGRAELLKHCLLAISQLVYDKFEVIVVADPYSLDAVNASGWSDRIKTAQCDVPNVAVARNMALELASGEVVAFLDDDCVPEPGWLFHLGSVFNDKTVDAAGGFVRGRNGISFQSKGQSINAEAVSEPFEIDGTAPLKMSGSATRAPKTEGTNCAFRRSAFEALGGFDPAFAYYLDDSDFNLRLGEAGRTTALVPLAEVHHQTAASQYRKSNRMPVSLHQIGKSIAIFLRNHSPSGDHVALLENALQIQWRRLVQHMTKRNCKRRDIPVLLDSMKAGMREGQGSVLHAVPNIMPAAQKFLPFNRPVPFTQHEELAGFRLHGKKLRALAVSRVAAGSVVSLYLFSRTALFHHVRFHPDGYWLQTGGLFGRSLRDEPLFRWTSMDARVEKERQRIALARHPWDIAFENYDH